jgi:hypothetical protein
MTRATKPKATRKPAKPVEYHIGLIGKRGNDGSLFVTSENFQSFSVTIPDGRWDEVLTTLKDALSIYGQVKDLRLTLDASELTGGADSGRTPAYVLAQVVPNAG